MPIQRLSLFGALPARHLEDTVHAIQSLSSDALVQFRTLTQVFRDGASPSQRPSDFLRSRHDVLAADREDHEIKDKDTPTTTTTNKPPVIEVIDAPEISKRPITSRIVHVIPCTSGDPDALARGMGYVPHYAFFEQGYAIQYGAAVMRIYQIFRAQNKATATAAEKQHDDGDDTEMQDNDEDNDDMKHHVVREDSGRDEEHRKRDAGLEGIAIGSGQTWIVQADIEARTAAPDDIKRGAEELQRLKRDLASYVDLVPLMDELR